MRTIDRTVKTLGELKRTGYRSRSIKEEIRENLIARLRDGKRIFNSIHGFDDSVIPNLQRAILSKHNIILLGLRGQAKTRIARLMIELLDEAAMPTTTVDVLHTGQGVSASVLQQTLAKMLDEGAGPRRDRPGRRPRDGDPRGRQENGDRRGRNGR